MPPPVGGSVELLGLPLEIKYGTSDSDTGDKGQTKIKSYTASCEYQSCHQLSGQASVVGID